MVLTIQVAVDIACFLKEPVRFAGTALGTVVQAYIIAGISELGVVFPVH
jgi:hypothetical protein